LEYARTELEFSRSFDKEKEELYCLSLCSAAEILSSKMKEHLLWKLHGHDGNGVMLKVSFQNNIELWFNYHLAKVFYDLKSLYGEMSTYQLISRNEKGNFERFTFHADFSKVDKPVLMELKFLKTTAGTKLTELTIKSHNYSAIPMIDNLGREFFNNVIAKDYEKIYSKSAGTLKEKRTFEQFEAYLKIIDKVGEIRSFRFFNHLMNITPDRNYLKIVYKVQINNNRIFFTLRFRNEDGTYKLEDVKM